MANQDAAFGFRPIGKVGQNRDNQGLSEYNIAASASAIFQNDPVQFLAHWYNWSSRHYNRSSIRIT
jgi:hypothetical protein